VSPYLAGYLGWSSGGTSTTPPSKVFLSNYLGWAFIDNIWMIGRKGNFAEDVGRTLLGEDILKYLTRAEE
jgi:hypothetical protein